VSALRAGVLGCGPRGREHAEALAQVEGVELVAVADLTAERREAAAASFGVPSRAGLDELLRADEPELLVLATPPRERPELVDSAARSGVPRAIVVEKPLALSLPAARRMVETCEQRGVLLTVGHQLRFCPELVALKAAVDAGRVGELELIRGIGFGNLLDQGPHLVDAVLWLAGDRRVLWAMSQRGDAATAGRPAGSLPPAGESHPAPPWMTSYLCLEGDLRAVIESGALYQRSSRFRDDWLQKRLVVVGSDGVAEAQVASHAELRSRNGAGRLAEGSVATYQAATRLFHEELRDVLANGGSHRSSASEALPALEALVACAQSAVDGDAAVLPLDEDRDPLAELAATRPEPRRRAPAGRRSATLDVSVILPLPDHRGYAADCVRSWVAAQTLAADRFELIVVADGSEPDVEAEVERLLRPSDRLLRLDEEHEVGLYDAAAREAGGRLLLFTEPHCIAEPACLDEVVRFIEAGGWDGACLRSTGISPNALARMEERMYDEGFEEWSRDGHWCKVILRGFALRREVYFEEAGFQRRYGRFAEFLLALTLHRSGRRLGYARAASVRHAYTTSLADFDPPTRDFTHGECVYRLEAPPQDYEPYLGTPPGWDEELAIATGLARAACSVAVRNLLRRSVWRAPPAARGMLKTLRRLGPGALAGPRLPLLRARLDLAAARARCLLWRPYERRLYGAWVDGWTRIVRSARREWLHQHRPQPPATPTLGRLEAVDVPAGRSFGLSPPESHAGRPFRWTGPVAVLDLRFPARTVALRLETIGLRPPNEPLCLWAFVNGRRLPHSAVSIEREAVVLRLDRARLDPGGDQRLALTCAPLEPWRSGSPDRRELGLALAAIEAR
jgi:predicted dehydrogenase/glycosyltransferase involved in cell wall biosynthesis